MSVSFFVYYRVANAPDSAVRGCVEAVRADVFAATGVRGRLLKRRDDPATWMEVYEPVVEIEPFEQALEAALVRHGFASLLAPGDVRHIERFIAV